MYCKISCVDMYKNGDAYENVNKYEHEKYVKITGRTTESYFAL